MRVLGLDISTHTGYAFGDGQGKYKLGVITYKPHPTERFIRWGDYARKLGNLITDNPVDVCCIEGYGYANHHTLAPLVELGTVLRMMLREREVPWFEVPPTTLKMFISGAGNSKKQQMMLALHVNFGLEIKDDNMADAQSLALFTEALLGRTRKLTPRHYVPVAKYLKGHPEVFQLLENLKSVDKRN